MNWIGLAGASNGCTEEQEELCGCGRTESVSEVYSCEYTEMTANEIINGKVGVKIFSLYLVRVSDPVVLLQVINYVLCSCSAFCFVFF